MQKDSGLGFPPRTFWLQGNSAENSAACLYFWMRALFSSLPESMGELHPRCSKKTSDLQEMQKRSGMTSLHEHLRRKHLGVEVSEEEPAQ
ncbi:hypothetical protein CHARACLAT_002898 [Characodon lateralis]|uniref:Uncharacterized protein n=1 Tax=Characodon lateralis TaxID=208331 RepID=A0ABU7E6P0_9TELE|nr:hypothetical protein [Characodon lateralis]